MIVLILEKVPATLRGELSRWLIEPRHGVFVGDPSAMVRDRLWEIVIQKVKTGGALLLYSYPNEQGFKAKSTGDTTRTLMDNEGLLMVHIRTEEAKKKGATAARVERLRDTARQSPDLPIEGSTTGSVPATSVASPSKRPSTRPRPLGKTHPLYGHQGPGDASDIAQHSHDPGYPSDPVLFDPSAEDHALARVGVRWRSQSRI